MDVHSVFTALTNYGFFIELTLVSILIKINYQIIGIHVSETKALLLVLTNKGKKIIVNVSDILCIQKRIRL